ncbi:zinc-dependent alcohol dehydrogenase family protein [Paenibacillus eucommiae]|uniref:2-desacetyl-2-hydroxyethyl bacteriochlorophyllide A dehydrogenase n=1 Tax=Paenibacillus eucommiae TaxID=1355755 RepID=A0ABS4J464_9BACL|nr:zinc-dependent alcohol dehydrogenase family protein [Paenibacillus eucommiae]MBP1994075.1 2-desacetyl-2-hydroxyethyl bacteriochlorophyllide A dehydrogenase [Paenibacillus eucommiae]
MKALVIEGPNQAVIKEVPYPKPGPGEITVKVEHIGICGTDIHIFRGEYVSPFPIIPGHEFSGTVFEIGEGVTAWEIGERVSAEPNISCNACRFCLTQRPNMCENWNAVGVTLNGAMAEFVVVPARLAVKLPDSMDFETAAFIEPMACVVHGLNRLQIKIGDRVLLFGAGAMGQQLIQSIARSGASELVVVDISKAKLDVAMKYGATKAVESRNLDAELGDCKGSNGFDIVIDATGIPKIIEQALDYMGQTAKYLQFGVTAMHDQIQIEPFKLFKNDWTIMGSMATNNTFLPAFQWLNEKRVEVKPLISKTISLEEAVDFFVQPRDPEDLKVQIKIQ